MKQKEDTYYITTPIYYPSGNWHVGHCYTTVICDSLARFQRMQKKDVFFLTGTDEHGQKIEKSAQKAGVTPQEYVDALADNLKDLWQLLGISYDKFIRTTDEEHVKAVQKIFKQLYDKGDIYKAEYTGLYCTPCEAFWTDTQAVGGKCPDCGRPVELAKEEAYFFRLSKYQDRILKHFEENPEFLQPKTRVNEMVNNFLKPGLSDLCVSRTSCKWGIPVSFDKKHTVYVWIDALSNYISALGYGSKNNALFKKYWPADLHMTAKEIIRFHTIIWPAILMALELPLPKKVYGHGWLLMGGDKLSKSKTENVKKDVVDPFILVDRYGADAVRYYLLREIPFGADGAFTNEALLSRINSDLCNDLGNLLSRTVSMIAQYNGGVIPSRGAEQELDEELISLLTRALPDMTAKLDALDVPAALAVPFRLVSRANKYIDETTPWLLAKDPAKKARLDTVLYNLAETLRIAAVLLAPFLPATAPRVFEQLGLGELPTDFSCVAYGNLPTGVSVHKGAALYPRVDIPKELQELEKIVKETMPAAAEPPKPVHKSEISIDEFAKTELRVAEVLAAERVPKADKLLKLRVNLGGGEERTVVSGIAKAYEPEALLGKKVVLVANLAPVVLRGILSEGMILCAEDDKGNLTLVEPNATVGSEIR